MRVVTIAACAVLSIGLSVARADEIQKAREKAKACSAQASGKQLSDEQFRAFMKACIASDRPATAPDERTKAIERRKQCAILANSKGLAGADRDAFIRSCLAGNAT